PSEDNVPRPEPVELDQDDRSENGQTSEWESEPQATTSATSSVPGPGTSAPEEPSDDEDEQFVDALTLPPQEQYTVPLPIKEEPSNDDQILSSNDVTEEVPPTIREHQVTASPYKLRQREPVDYRKLHMGAVTQATTNLLTNRNETLPMKMRELFPWMSQQQLEQAAGMEGDPPFDEAVQQIFDTFQEETEANATIPEDTVTTPEPCNAPQNTLAGIVNCIRYAGRADMHMTRAANSHAAVVAMMRLARWIPQYQRIAQERDVLLEQREQWRTERDEILREQATARREIQELKRALGLETTEPLAARIVVSLPATNVNPPMTPSTSSQSQPSERGPGEAGGTVIAPQEVNGGTRYGVDNGDTSWDRQTTEWWPPTTEFNGGCLGQTSTEPSTTESNGAQMQSPCDVDAERELQRRIEETVQAALRKHDESTALEIQKEASRLQRQREIQIRKVILQNFISQTEYLRAETLEAVVAKHVEYMMEFHKFNDRLSRMHAEAIKQLDNQDMAMMTDTPLETVASLEVGEFDPNIVRQLTEQLTVGITQTGLDLPYPNGAFQANGASKTNGASQTNGVSQTNGASQTNGVSQTNGASQSNVCPPPNGDRVSSTLDLNTPFLNIYKPQPEERLSSFIRSDFRQFTPLQNGSNILKDDHNFAAWRKMVIHALSASNTIAALRTSDYVRQPEEPIFSKYAMEQMKNAVCAYLKSNVCSKYEDYIKMQDCPIQILATLEEVTKAANTEEYDDLNRKFTNLQFDPTKQTIVSFNDEFNSLLRKMEHFDAHRCFKVGADAELYIRNRYLAAISKVFPDLYKQQTSDYAAKERVGLAEIMRRAQSDFNRMSYEKPVAEPSTSAEKTKDSALIFKSRSKSFDPGNCCYVCGTIGHFKKNCPNLVLNPDNPKTCYNCQRVGHLSAKCPFKQTPKSKAAREKEKKGIARQSRDRRSRSRGHSSTRDQSCDSLESTRSSADLRPMNGRSEHGRRRQGRVLPKRRSTRERSETPAPQKKRRDSTRGKAAMAWERCNDEDAISLSSPSLDDNLC
ncbi:hypothetical protein GE061_008728, partial [Apolygus lucorum]